MKVGLFDFQEDALADLRNKLMMARQMASVNNPHAVSFSAPTGAGKTIVMTALFEDIFFGEPGFDIQSDAVILWISDMPELNEQTRLKIEGKSDRIRVRQLVTIDSSFDAEYLADGHIYFMNTQKLGSDKLLTRKGDDRQFTIWETLANTAQLAPDRFYVVIDEAHRGMRGGNTEKAQTILQRFLVGSADDGMCRMPLVIGISATPHRFEQLLSGTTHTVHKVYIRSEEVRDSGLLKDRILIHYPDTASQAEMTLLAEAANRWQTIEKRWTRYCQNQDETVVFPVLVVQVEDGTEKQLTKTNLSTSLATVESAIGRRLREGEVAHTFNDCSDLDVDGHRVRRIEASRIEEERNIGVVLFKMSLSTGWDCPRAEVMMSFRRAQDHTYIAQLLGRMVRTPLARRVEADAALNDVHLFLPHYDQATVKAVIQDLKNVEDVPPSQTGTSRELITLYRRMNMDKVFDSIGEELETYRVNAVRRQSALRRLMGLGRGLTHERIDESSQETVRARIVEKMFEEVQRLRDAGTLEKRVKQITGVDLKIIAVTHDTSLIEGHGDYTLEAASADIDRHFQQAGRLLGNGLHMDYWRAQGDRDADEVKVEVIALAQDNDGMKRLEALAEREFNALYSQHKRAIGKLREQRQQHFQRLRLATNVPKTIPWALPETIDFRRSPDAPEYDKHLFLEENGNFRADLGTWEKELLKEELTDRSVIGWLRNVDRKLWSLEIPYEEAGSVKPMFPDLLVVRQDSQGLQFDILEPHDPSLKDNAAKALGLAKFAEQHWASFDRIQLIRKKKGADGVEKYFRLDVGNAAVRKKVMAVTSNSQLDQVFDDEAVTR